MQKVGGLKYSAPNINVYVLMIFTGFSLKSGGALAPPAPPFPPPMILVAKLNHLATSDEKGCLYSRPLFVCVSVYVSVLMHER